MDTEDYDYEDLTCPKCGHSPLHSRSCSILNCDEGYLDEYDEDPINWNEGELFYKCSECKGTGIVRWCPSCGEDLTAHEFRTT